MATVGRMLLALLMNLELAEMLTMPVCLAGFRLPVRCLARILCVAGVLSLPGLARAQTTPVDLGTLGADWSYADKVSDNGVVVGVSARSGDFTQRPFVWTAETGMIELSLGGPFTRVTDVGRTGIVVGYGVLPDNTTRGFVWTRADGLRNLGTLEGGWWSQAQAVSDNGVVFGSADRCTPEFCTQGPFAWTAATGMIDLTSLDLGGASKGGFTARRPFNSAGMLVASSWINDERHAVAWTVEHGVTDLGTLGGGWSEGLSVNDAGEAVGNSTIEGDAVIHAFIWTREEGMRSLGTLGGPNSFAVDISNGGFVVGTSLLAGDDPATGGEEHAFRWSQSLGMIDLGTLGGSRSLAAEVSDDGVVAGTSLTADNLANRAFVWTDDSGMLQMPATFVKKACKASSLLRSCFHVLSRNGVFADGSAVWSRSTGVQVLSLGGTSSFIDALSDSGIAVGGGMAPEATWQPFVWTPERGLVQLAILGGFDGGEAYAVNNSGIAVGESWQDVAPYASRATLWNTRATATTLAASAETSTFGTAVTLTATVTSAGGNPSGAVEFLDGQTSLGTASLNGGSASLSVATLAVGSHTISARYAGDGSYPGSTSVAVGHSVVRAATTTTLVVEPATSRFGDGVILRASVTSPVPVAGVVEFLDGVASLGTAAVDAAGFASLTTSTLAVGVHSLTARYLTSASFSGSTSSSATLTVLAGNVAPTPTGSGVVTEPVATLPDGSTAPVTVSFGAVTQGGTTTVTTSTSGAPPPDGFKIVGGLQPIYYDVSTTAIFSGTATLCLSWREGDIRNENGVRLFHLEGGRWVDITISRNPAANVVCGQTASFSPFVIGEDRIAGFYQPVDPLPVLNVLKAGAAVPVKFSLGGNEGLDIFLAGYPSSAVMACGGAGTADAIEQTSAATTSGLSYDAASGQYTYVWKTSKEWAGTCRQFRLRLKDGTVKSANFSFTR